MNKKFAIVLALALIAIVCCAGCIDPQEPVDPVNPVDPVDPVDPITPVDPVVPAEEYSVIFMLNYGEAGAYTAETVTAGDAVAKPTNPTRSGYTFKGWFTAAEGGAEYDFTQAVNADLTLYAQWKKKSSSSSGGHSHRYTSEITTQPTCGAEGVKTFTCSCGDSYTETIPATGDHPSTKLSGTDVICTVCNTNLGTVVAQVGDNYYASFESAMDAVENDGTVILIAGVTDGEVTKNVVINTNNTVTSLKYDAGLTIKIQQSTATNLSTVMLGDAKVFFKVGTGTEYAADNDGNLIVAYTVEGATYTVMDADAAQYVLDNAVKGTTIQLVSGVNYGTLVFGQNSQSKVVDITDIGGDSHNPENEYYSKYEDITIIGAEGATVDQITFDTGKDDELTIWNYIDVKNLIIKDVTFTGTKTAVNIPDGYVIAIDGLSIVNCEMTDTTGENRLVWQPHVGYKPLNDKTSSKFVMTAGVKNLVINNCKVTDAHQVIETRQMENLTITNNVFKGIKARDILMSANTNGDNSGITYTGTITITGNTADASKERFVRAAGIGDATVIIKDNTITNYLGGVENSDFIKVTGQKGSNSVIENNVREIYGLKLTCIYGDSNNYGVITVSDKEGLLNLSKLFEEWHTLFAIDENNNGTYEYGEHPEKCYYYDWTWDIVLTADIDFESTTINPIDLGYHRVFDGHGHTIKNAVITTDSTTENEAGLFDGAECGFKNLKLDNIHVTGSYIEDSTAGVLAGSCNRAIDGIIITGSSVTGGKYTGGVVGYGYTDVTNCQLTNVEVKGGYKMGGIIGYICATSPAEGEVTGNTLTGCTVEGSGSYADDKSQYYVGHIVGHYNCDGTCNNNVINSMITTATENIGLIQSGKTVTQS